MCSRRSSFRCRVAPILLSAALALSFLVAPAAPAAAQSASGPTPPAAQAGQSGPPVVVNLAHLPAAAARSLAPAPTLPFLPRTPASFPQAKQAANAPHAAPGAAAPVVAAAAPVTAAGMGSPQTVQTLGSFPVMSSAAQVALYGADQEVTPPDTQLAAGPTDLFETVNDSGSIWTKSGALIGTYDLNSFFPVPTTSYYTFTDPHVLYDPLSSRWFASGLSFNYQDFGGSQTYVAVSATSDPTGLWYVYTIESNTSGVIYDQPKIGVGSDKVVISWNDYGGYGTTFTGAETWVIQKSSMLTGSYTLWDWYGPDPYRFDVVPSQSLTATATEYLVYNNSDPSLEENLGYPTIGVVAITGTPDQGNVAWTETDPSIFATQLPPNAGQPAGPSIATDDDRFLSAVWQNNTLWVTGNDGCLESGLGDYACLRALQVTTDGPGVAFVDQDFDIAMTSGSLFYPAVALDPSGDAFFSFSLSSSSYWASTAMTDQPIGSPAATDGGLFLVQPGFGEYDDCGSSCGTSSNRWGDYSAAALDPVLNGVVWLTGEYAGSTSDVYDWATGTDEVSLAVPPTVTPTDTATATVTPVSPTVTPTNTATATFTPIPPTATMSPTPTDTPLPVATPTRFPYPYPPPSGAIYLPFAPNSCTGCGG